MLKFAKNSHARSMCDLTNRLNEKNTPTVSDASSLSGSCSGSDSGSSSGVSSMSENSTETQPRPKTPFIDRKLTGGVNRKPDTTVRMRHSMYDARGAGFYRSSSGVYRSEEDLSYFAPPPPCRSNYEPIKMQIVWNGIVVWDAVQPVFLIVLFVQSV